MRRTTQTILAFLGWLAVGFGMTFGLLAILTVGIFVLPCAVLLAVFLAWRGYGKLAGPSLLIGSGLVLLYVAYLNRGGPGFICTTSAVSQTCTQEMSPWPWLAAGLIVAGAGITLGRVVLGRANRSGRR